MSNTCVACGSGEVIPLRRSGRRMPFRHMADLELPEDVAIPTCTECGEEWIDAGLAEEIDRRLYSAYQSELARKTESAIAHIQQFIPQRDLERLLGLSGGYLSKLKGGKDASPPLVALLLLLANEPARINELRRLWSAKWEGFGAANVLAQTRPIRTFEPARIPATAQSRTKLERSADWAVSGPLTDLRQVAA